jgi:hypothetical protein
MQRVTNVVGVMVVLGFAGRLSASDHTGIYAIIEEVTHSATGTPEETIQVRGVFSLATGRRDYKPPVYGYMFFRLKKGNETICRKEWADLQRVAGTGKTIAFASRYLPGTRKRNPLGRVRKLREKPARPDKYPEYSLDFGVQKVRRSLDYLPHRRLGYFPRPSSPPDGAAVEEGRITLVSHNVLAKDEHVEYFFEIKDSDGRTESSGAVAPGEKQTRWTPEMKIEPVETYTWRVWTVTQRKDRRTGKTEPWKGPVVTFQFQGKT